MLAQSLFVRLVVDCSLDRAHQNSCLTSCFMIVIMGAFPKLEDFSLRLL